MTERPVVPRPRHRGQRARPVHPGRRAGHPGPHRPALPGLPRFAVAAVHRTVSLTALGLLAVHIGTLFLDPFAQLRLVDLVVPFGGAYRPLWLGFGTLAADLVADPHRVEPAAAAHRAAHLAGPALGRVPVLAPGAGPRDRQRDRRHQPAGCRHRRRVCGLGRGSPDLADLVVAGDRRATDHRCTPGVGAPDLGGPAMTVTRASPPRRLAGGRLRARRPPAAARPAARPDAAVARAAVSDRPDSPAGAARVPDRTQAGGRGAGGRGVVVANGAEGEPASAKDRFCS